MRSSHRIYGLLLALLLAVGLVLPALADAPTTQATILFTHDMHSHLLPPWTRAAGSTAAMPA